MNRLLKFNTHNQKIWFVSDIHAKHAKEFILKPRNYTDAELAYEAMIKAWNDVVGVNDIVFNLGDIVVGAGTESRKVADELIRRLNGQQFFIWGNHNAGVNTIYKEAIRDQFGVSTDDLEVYPLTYLNKFIFLGNYAEIVVDGQFIVLSHYPIGSWNELGKLSWNIHGHCHGAYENGKPTNKDFRQLDVGWETFGRPVEFHEVKRIMNSKGGKLVDHHGRD